MPQVSRLMTTDVHAIGPEESLQRAAQMMDRLNVACLPVCSGKRLLGMVTDRDITVRGTAAGLAPTAGCVSDVMSHGIAYCTEDQDSEHVMRLMADVQAQHLPVINLNRELVGMVTLDTLAARHALPEHQG